MPIVIGPCLRADARFGLCATVLFFFMAGLLLHFECVSIGSLSHPAGDRPSHSISVSARAYFTDTVTRSWLLFLPIATTTGTAAPGFTSVGTTALTWISAARPGAAPA